MGVAALPGSGIVMQVRLRRKLLIQVSCLSTAKLLEPISISADTTACTVDMASRQDTASLVLVEITSAGLNRGACHAVLNRELVMNFEVVTASDSRACEPSLEYCEVTVD